MEPRLVIQDIPFVRRGPEEKEEICRVVSDGRNFFRLSAQAFIVDDQGRFYSFVMPNYNNRNFRQPVQGGLDAGETAVEAALRETKEEIGVDRDCLEFLSFIVPGGEVDITEENWKDAVNLGDSFRYDTKLRQIGLKSQQLVPVLFTVKSGATLHINFSEEEYPTFVAAKLCHLNDLATCAATCKKPVMAMIVEAAVETILALDARGRWNRPLDYVTGPAAPEVSLISRGRGRGRGRGMSERGGHRDANAAPLNTDDRGRGRGGRGGRGRGRGDRGRGGRGRGFVNDANRQQGYQANAFYGEREERTRRHENEMNQQAAHQQEMQYEHQS